MKKTFLSIITAFLFITNSNANENKDVKTYTLDPHHSNVSWSVDHFGFSKVSGKFSEIEGKIFINEKIPSLSKVDILINMDNLTTGYQKFDDHLKSEDMFNVRKFPTASFASTKIVITGKNQAKIYGILMLNDVSKPVILNAKLNKSDIHPVSQKKSVGFSATATINRSDFNISYAVPAVSDKVNLTIETEAAIAEPANQ